MKLTPLMERALRDLAAHHEDTRRWTRHQRKVLDGLNARGLIDTVGRDYTLTEAGRTAAATLVTGRQEHLKLTSAQERALREASLFPDDRTGYVHDGRVGNALVRKGLAEIVRTSSSALDRGAFGRWHGGTKLVTSTEYRLTAEGYDLAQRLIND